MFDMSQQKNEETTQKKLVQFKYLLYLITGSCVVQPNLIR